MAKQEPKSSGDKASGKTTVRPCTCPHAFQDRQYGAGRRVYNIGKERVTCTVCGKVISTK